MIACSGCRYYQPIEPADSGECRAGLPAPVQLEFDNPECIAAWPEVDPLDWCGEHEPIHATISQPVRYLRTTAVRIGSKLTRTH